MSSLTLWHSWALQHVHYMTARNRAISETSTIAAHVFKPRKENSLFSLSLSSPLVSSHLSLHSLSSFKSSTQQVPFWIPKKPLLIYKYLARLLWYLHHVPRRNSSTTSLGNPRSNTPRSPLPPNRLRMRLAANLTLSLIYLSYIGVSPMAPVDPLSTAAAAAATSSFWVCPNSKPCESIVFRLRRLMSKGCPLLPGRDRESQLISPLALLPSASQTLRLQSSCLALSLMRLRRWWSVREL